MTIKSPETEQEWNDYYALRYEVLRKPWGQAPGSERNSGDETAMHFALWENDQLVAVARLDYVNPTICQIRFVAVAPGHQGKGYGKAIMKAVEEKAAETCEYATLHARENALAFYFGMGYKIIEPSHVLFDEIQHYFMRKKLH